MEIKVGFEISYAAAQPTPMVIMLSDSSLAVCRHRRHRNHRRRTERADRILSRQFWQCLRTPGGARRRRHLPWQRAGARFRLARHRQRRTAQQIPIEQLPDELLALSDAEPLLRDRQAHRHRLVVVRQHAAGLGAGAGDLPNSSTITSPSAISTRIT